MRPSSAYTSLAARENQYDRLKPLAAVTILGSFDKPSACNRLVRNALARSASCHGFHDTYCWPALEKREKARIIYGGVPSAAHIVGDQPSAASRRRARWQSRPIVKLLLSYSLAPYRAAASSTPMPALEVTSRPLTTDALASLGAGCCVSMCLPCLRQRRFIFYVYVRIGW